MKKQHGCPHPPARLYSWWAYDMLTEKNDWLCVSCCACGMSLKGDNDAYERYLVANGVELPNGRSLS